MKFYITNAIPYVNAAPHLGFALEIVQTDVIARFKRILGDDVLFAAGTDENSLKNVRSAEKEGITTQKLVNKYAEEFKNLKEKEVLNLSYDIFNRTSSENHFKGAQKLWLACNPDDIYKKSYTGLYCVGCEEFYTEDELIEGKCPDHKVVPEKVSEENYFFKLSKYQKEIEDLISNDTIKIVPDIRKNEVLSFIKSGLQDFSISRSVERAKGWGVPVPNDSTQIMYVWFDALATYLTSLGYGGDDEKLFSEFWSNESEKVHVIGKGIVRFHAIYWIAMLLSAKLPLPNTEFVHGYITVNGQKISKSLGNAINPYDLTKKYGTDAVRYYLLSKFSPFYDGDFSEEKFKETYNADLANGLGNTVSRLAKLAENSGIEFKETKIPENVYSHELLEAFNEFRFNDVLQNIWQTRLSGIDQHINQRTPWAIKDKNELKVVLQEEIDELRIFAKQIEPFLPETAKKIEEQFRGPKISSQKPLFPRI